MIDDDRVREALAKAKDKAENGVFLTPLEKDYFTHWYEAVREIMNMDNCHGCLDNQGDDSVRIVVRHFCGYMLGPKKAAKFIQEVNS